MAKVVLWGSLKVLAGGETTCEVEAATIREMLDALTARHPKLAPVLASGVAVAIDGQIYRDDWFQPIGPDSEVYVLPHMAGG